MVAQAFFCRSRIKVKFFIDQVRPALGSVGWLSPCSKSLKIALFQTFSSWHPNTFYPTALYWPGTAFYWPSTTKYQIVPGPVPSFINQYHPTLTHYHQEPTRTAPYWPISTKYQPIPPHKDPVSPNTNQRRPILTHYYHKPTSTALYWPSTTKYQPVPPHTDPLPPQTNQYRPILAKYHQVPTSLHCTERAMLQLFPEDLAHHCNGTTSLLLGELLYSPGYKQTQAPLKWVKELSNTDIRMLPLFIFQ